MIPHHPQLTCSAALSAAALASALSSSACSRQLLACITSSAAAFRLSTSWASSTLRLQEQGARRLSAQLLLLGAPTC
jgi:hypothetical protein